MYDYGFRVDGIYSAYYAKMMANGICRFYLSTRAAPDSPRTYFGHPRGTSQIDDISTWLPQSLETPWRNVFL